MGDCIGLDSEVYNAGCLISECVSSDDTEACASNCMSRATAREAYIKTLGTPPKALHENEESYVDTAGIAAAAIAMVAVGVIVGAVIVRVRPAFEEVPEDDESEVSDYSDSEDEGRKSLNP
jgi:hypothetical protein